MPNKKSRGAGANRGVKIVRKEESAARARKNREKRPRTDVRAQRKRQRSSHIDNREMQIISGRKCNYLREEQDDP